MQAQQMVFMVHLLRYGITCTCRIDLEQQFFINVCHCRDINHYAGPYLFNEDTGEVQGCPAQAETVKAVVEAVKIHNKSKEASVMQNHANAMSLDEIQKLMRWSTSICPDSLLTAFVVQSITDAAELNFWLEHAFMHTFMSSAFTLWTR